MTAMVASAPGKVVLSGEYAVLDGAAATCMAVDRRARVSVQIHDQPWHQIVAPGFSAVEGRFVVTGAGVEWSSGRDAYALFDEVWQQIDATPAGHLSFSLDTEEFRDTASGVKMGVGSSAALAAALATLLCTTLAPDDSPARVAAAAHRKFQGGVGSGVDIACSLMGGLIEYRMDRDEQIQIEWPEGLCSALLWSGVASGTAEKIKRLELSSTRQSRADLGAAAEQMAGAWKSGSAQRVLDGYEDYMLVLKRFSVDHELGIFDAGHGALVDAAGEMGLIYKPCGAGGGDIGIVLGRDAAAIAAFVARPVAAEFVQLDAVLDPCGAMIARENH